MSDENDFLAPKTPEAGNPEATPETPEEPTSSGSPAEPEQPTEPEAPSEPERPTEPEAPAEPVIDVAAVEKKIAELETERAKIEAETQTLTDEINEKVSSAEEFMAWTARHRRTFLWKMYAKMRDQIAAVVAKETSYETFMSNVEVPEPGELVRLRKRFHKTVLSALSVGLGFWLVYFLITNYVPYAWVLKFTSLGGLIFRYLISGIIATIFGALVLYYRDWRRFDWKVKTLNHDLEDVAKGVDHVRQEKVRLVSLYPQVKDWLEIIGYSLNRPWTMNDRWFKSYMSDLNQDEFPFSLRIAQAQERDASSMHKLQGSTMKRVAVRGWRSKVLKDQVLAIAQKVGLPVERMNIEELDRDIAYSPGGPRVEMRKGLENQEALELVARRQLIPLTYKVQSEEITKSRPPVKENRTNILDPIQADLAGLEEEERVDWDKFLQEPIGPFNGVITPFSLASLAEGEVLRGHHEKLVSHFVVPERLEEVAKQNPGAHVETYLESANLPMDIVIRMDLSLPMPPHAVKINPKSETYTQSESSTSTSAVDVPVDEEDHDDD